MSLLKHLETICSKPPLLGDYSITTFLATNLGCCRTNNEDYIHYSSLDKNQPNALAIVADGMGGHAAGETASHEAVHCIQTHYFAKHFCSNPIRNLKSAVIQANKHIYQLAVDDPVLSGMGTTVTALAIVKGYAYYAHVGDSRLYLLRNGVMQQLTQDHTLVAQMLGDGLITKEQAQTHPDRNIITRALGTKPIVEVDVVKSPIPIQVDDVFVLCSDGLYDLVTDSDIAKLVSEHNPSGACHLLIESARSAGGYDNISVIIVTVQGIKTKPIKAAITRF
ncbi:MAG: Stp1/IreP family PP2C-type Ser/Thr phosphatase [Methylobacter sp.]